MNSALKKIDNFENRFKKNSHSVDNQHDSGQTPRKKLRLATYNIQTGISTNSYQDYITHSWKHVLPHAQRTSNLNAIAHHMSDFDIVGLQEVDAGSLRSGFINQTEYLAMRARFQHWNHITNRNLGKLAQHSLGLLSRYKISSVERHRLPGFIPGRGALLVELGSGDQTLTIAIVHLALSMRARLQQLETLAEILSARKNVILMGDMNFQTDSKEMNWINENMFLREPIHGLFTFPSWKPDKNIDHILVSPSLEIKNVKVLGHAYSDHLPISMEILLPENFSLEVI